jgi:hypothetical protein
MTPASSLLDPASPAEVYVASVLTLFVDLPDTPLRATTQDQRHAHSWFARGVPLPIIETALLLASLRRKTRAPDMPRLPRIRSLAYFQPVVDELLENTVAEGYLHYLRHKLRQQADKASTAGFGTRARPLPPARLERPQPDEK